MYCGFMPGMKSGDVTGHEFMGIIDDVGPEVKNFKKGNHLSCVGLCVKLTANTYCIVIKLVLAISLNYLTFVQVIAW